MTGTVIICASYLKHNIPFRIRVLRQYLKRFNVQRKGNLGHYCRDLLLVSEAL